MDKERFLIRLYEWARDQWEREISAGLPRLKALPCRALRTAAAVLARRPKDEQLQVAAALLKKFHPEACRLLAQPATSGEEAVFEKFRAERFEESTREGMQGKAAAPKIDMTRLRKQLREAMVASTGARPDPGYTVGVEWRHVQHVAGLRVVTYIDTGGRVRQAEYHHDLYAENGAEIKRFISLAAWLGLGQTTFDCIGPGHEDEAVGQLVAVSEHFIRALPGLLGQR